MEDIKKMILTQEMLRKLNNYIGKVFEKTGTDKSRQRIVYDLLNTVKSNDQTKFMNIILKQINNSNADNHTKKELIDLLSNLYVNISTLEEFEKVAYSIIMGIMKTINDKGGEENGE